MCGGICGPAGEMSVGRCSVCYRPYRQCACLNNIPKIKTKTRGGLKKRVVKKKALTKPLRSKKPTKGT